jgi:hypothetical protein
MKMSDIILSIDKNEVSRVKPNFYVSARINRGKRKFLVSTMSLPLFMREMGHDEFETGVFEYDKSGKINAKQLLTVQYSSEKDAAAGHKKIAKGFKIGDIDED